MPDVFPIVPSGGRPLWLLVPVGLVLLIAFGMLALSLGGARAARFEISDAGLRLYGDLYGRLVPAEALRADAARIVNLDAERDLAPRRRTVGTAMPGYRAGWFKLRNGEKALLYLTDGSRAVYVPTTLGYSLLLSPQRPDAFLERLRAAAR